MLTEKRQGEFLDQVLYKEIEQKEVSYFVVVFIMLLTANRFTAWHTEYEHIFTWFLWIDYAVISRGRCTGNLDLNMKGRWRQYKEIYELPLLFLRKEESFCIFYLTSFYCFHIFISDLKTFGDMDVVKKVTYIIPAICSFELWLLLRLKYFHNPGWFLSLF